MPHEDASRWRRPAAVAIVALALAGSCGGVAAATTPSESADTTDAAESQPLSVIASFYPLQFALAQVGGELIGVSNLTPPGVEPHDIELTPQATAALSDADLVVYLAGFAPVVDEAIDNLPAEQVFDVTPAARLDVEGGEDDHDHDGLDPHFWLDPTRLADVTDAIAARLGELDPDNADTFTANAATLRGDLEALDGEYQDGLAQCASTDLVTSHTAFAYLAQRYGLTQIGITGVTPEDEPTPAELADITHLVEDHGITTIYAETLVDPALSETVASETGATTAVLDPIEGITDDTAGSDYFTVMRSNLETLRAGQDCA